MLGAADGIDEGTIGACDGQLLHDNWHSSSIVDPLETFGQNLAIRKAVLLAFWVNQEQLLFTVSPLLSVSNLYVVESLHVIDGVEGTGCGDGAFDGVAEDCGDGAFDGVAEGTELGSGDEQVVQLGAEDGDTLGQLSHESGHSSLTTEPEDEVFGQNLATRKAALDSFAVSQPHFLSLKKPSL